MTFVDFTNKMLHLVNKLVHLPIVVCEDLLIVLCDGCLNVHTSPKIRLHKCMCVFDV